MGQIRDGRYARERRARGRSAVAHCAEFLESRRLLSAASFGAPVSTALPSGFVFAGMVPSDYPGQDFVAKNPSGGGVVVRWHSDGTFSVVGQVNTSAQVLSVDTQAAGWPEVVYTTQGLASQLPDGTFFTPPVSLPGDLVPGTVGRLGSGLGFLRYDPDPSHPGLGTLILANLQRDLSKMFVTVGGINIFPVAVLKPEVDTILATGIAPPAVDIPVFAGLFDDDQVPDVIAGGYSALGNADGTFRVTGTLDTFGFTSQTRFMYDPISSPYTNFGRFVLAYPVAPTGGSPAAVEFRDSHDGAFKVARKIAFPGATGDALVAGMWTNGAVSDMATAEAGGIEVFPARGDGTYLDPEHVGQSGLIPFATALNTNDINHPIVYMLCAQSTPQGTNLVSLPDTAERGPISIIAPSVNPSVVGEPVTIRAMVAGFPGQTLSFCDGPTKLADVQADEHSDLTLRVSTLSAGTHQISVKGTFYVNNFEFASFTQNVVPPPQDRPYLVVSGFSVTPTVTLSGAVPATSDVNVSVTLTNLGGTAGAGNVNVASTLTTAVAVDAIQRVLEPTVSLAVSVTGLDSTNVTIGAGKSVTLHGDWNVPDTVPPRYYVLDARVSGDAGLGLSADLAGPVNVAPSMQIVWGFGGDTPAQSIPFVKDLGGGNVVTFTLTGGGIGLVTPDDPSGTLGNGGPDFSVQLSATTRSSDLKVTQIGTTKSNIVNLTMPANEGGDLGSADLSEDTPRSIRFGDANSYFTRVGSLKLGTIPAAQARTGAPGAAAPKGGVIIVGTLGSLEMPNLDEGDVSVTGNDTRTPMTVTIGNISSGRSLVTTQPIDALTVTSAGGGSSIEAYLIGRLDCTNDFDANLTLTAPPGALPALGTARIVGSIVGTPSAPAMWQIAGNVGRVRVAGNVSNLSLICGAKETPSNSGDGTFPLSYVAATLLGFDVEGNMQSSVIAAGVDPVDGVLGNGDDHLIKGGAITEIRVAGSLDSTKFLAAKVAPIDHGATSSEAHLVFTSQPGDVLAGRRGGAGSVELVDNSGKPVTTDRSMVTLSIASGSGTGTIVGRVRLVDGVAHFAGFSSKKASFYSLEADAGNFAPALSDAFHVMPDKGVRLRLVDLASFNSGVYGGHVEVVDRFGNRTADSSSTLIFKPIPPRNPLSAFITSNGAGESPVVFDNGLATFDLAAFGNGSESGYFVSTDKSIRGVRAGKIYGH